MIPVYLNRTGFTFALTCLADYWAGQSLLELPELLGPFVYLGQRWQHATEEG